LRSIPSETAVAVGVEEALNSFINMTLEIERQFSSLAHKKDALSVERTPFSATTNFLEW
jgi:hypothetical protein